MIGHDNMNMRTMDKFDDTVINDYSTVIITNLNYLNTNQLVNQ